ncbi:MAG: FHA domain-containing protein [Deltaproteobacteria bacterium]|nr:FHA domain-containing protein [Deltaproteobacteria bacterium]
MIRCAECGHENMDGLEYCDACGAKLPATAAPTPEPASVDLQADAAGSPEAVAVSAPAETPPAPVGLNAVSLKAKLTITRGGTVGKEFVLQTGDNLVGRWDPDSGAFPEVDLELDDPEARISRKHALLRVAEQLSLEDIGSLNGTFVNRGKRLEPGSPVTLNDGDEIIIGKTFFKVSVA